jgi:hypothetical protein
MEKHLPKLLTLLLLIISSSSLFAQTSTITFDASNYYKGTTSVTKDGVTITYTGFDSRNESYRINKDEYLIITSTIGNITKVVLTSPNKLNLIVISLNDFVVSSRGTGTWTGNCNPVGIFAKTGQALFNKIEVTVDKSKESNVDVTISSAGWATYVSKKAIDFTCSPVKAFTAKYDTKANTITLTKLEPEQIPANTPVVLKGNAGSYIFQQISSAKAVSNNDLKFKAEDFVVPEDKTYYGLAQKGEGCGFYPVEKGETVPAYKCYLLLSNPSAAKSFYPFNIATGIQSAVWRPIQQRGVRYNLAGQRVGDSYKGVVIENGKKIVVK